MGKVANRCLVLPLEPLQVVGIRSPMVRGSFRAMVFARCLAVAAPLFPANAEQSEHEVKVMETGEQAAADVETWTP